MRRSGYVERLLAVVALLVRKERTAAELASLTGAKDGTTGRYLRLLADEGLVEQTGATQRQPRVYSGPGGRVWRWRGLGTDS